MVRLNCAVSSDGRLAAPDGSPVRLSCDADMQRVHRMRAECDAILVGIGTVLADDPKLTVKRELVDGEVEDPLRVVLDTKGRTPPGAHVLDGAAPTLIVTGPKATTIIGAHQARVPLRDGGLDLEAVLGHLGAIGIRSLMVEGGEAVLRSFLEARLWDAYTMYVAPRALGGDGPRLWDTHRDELGLPWTDAPLGDGRLVTFQGPPG